MKKILAYALVAMLMLAMTATAWAAAPLADVPAKHWAYAAVAQLAKAGLVDGYGDGTFRGDRTMTRYEMAIVVAKAIDRFDKADAANQALINKLSSEFAAELNRLGMRLAMVESRITPLKIGADFRLRYENVDNPWAYNPILGTPYSSSTNATEKGETRMRVYLKLEGAVAPGVTFYSKFNSESLMGKSATTAEMVSPVMETGCLWFSNIKGFDSVSVGRLNVTFGKGLIVGTPYFDGLRAVFGSRDVKFSLASGKRFGTSYDAGNMWVKASDQLQFNVTMFKAHNDMYYNTVGGSMFYKINPDLEFAAEYGKNNTHKLPAGQQAWLTQLKYKGADQKKEGSYGIWIQYKKYSPFYDVAVLTDAQNTTPWNYGSAGGASNNLKGFEYGYDLTLTPNVVWSVKYNPVKDYYGVKDRKFLVTEINAYF